MTTYLFYKGLDKTVYKCVEFVKAYNTFMLLTTLHTVGLQFCKVKDKCAMFVFNKIWGNFYNVIKIFFIIERKLSLQNNQNNVEC